LSCVDAAVFCAHAYLHCNTHAQASSLLSAVNCICPVQASFIATHPSVKAVRGLRLAGNKKYLAAVEQTYDDEAQQVGKSSNALA
jgi:hypothetical protein